MTTLPPSGTRFVPKNLLGEKSCVLHSLMVEAQPKRQGLLFPLSDSLQAFQTFTCFRSLLAWHSRSRNLGVRLSCGTSHVPPQGCRTSSNKGLEGTGGQGVNTEQLRNCAEESTAAFILFHRQLHCIRTQHTRGSEQLSVETTCADTRGVVKMAERSCC